MFPMEDRLVLQGLRSAVLQQENELALHDVEITVNLDTSGKDYVLTVGSGNTKIYAHRNAENKVEIKHYCV